jgi:hypothetical protein
MQYTIKPLLSILILLTIFSNNQFFPTIQLVTVTSAIALYHDGLNFPVAFKFAPDGRIFYNEKNTGNIRIILRNNTLLQAPFATVPGIFTDGESGLLGIALDPSFSTNNFVYVYYTYRDTLSYTHGHIARYTANGNIGINPVDIFDVASSAPNTIYHNGGYIKFGPDGKLYAQVGEFHQDQRAQDPSGTDGKILRMNNDGSVPNDNPFPGTLVYATGFRNGFGFDFDTSNNRFIATMAGPSSDDKILIIVKGGNYGWPTCVGYCHDSRFIDPIVDFTQIVTPTGIATVNPDMYVFGEWNTGNLEQLQLDTTGNVVSMTQIYTAPSGIISVETDLNNTVYFTTQNAFYTYSSPKLPPSTPSGNNSSPAISQMLTTIILLVVTVGVAIVVLLIIRRRRLFA